MTVFVLVHGGGHSRRCWDKVVPALHAMGHRAIAPDLPGMGDDSAALAQATLGGWGDFIAGIAKDAGEPVVLVGHSRGGPVIGEAAERSPESLLGLIYLTAVLLPGGVATIAALGSETPHLMENVRTTADGLGFIFDREVARRCFYHRASHADAETSLDQLCPEPLAPNHELSTLTAERWGQVPRAYIECTDDRALPIALQRRMHAAIPCDPVISLDSDHSPFVCMPVELASQLSVVADHFKKSRK